MKKTIMLIALFVGFTGFSQETSEYKDDALKLVKMTMEGRFEVMLEPIKNRIPVENQEAFMNDVRATLPELYSQIAEVYMKNYSHVEIEKILAFYQSPIGQKVVAKTPAITQQSMQIGQTWGAKLRPLMAKYMQ